MGKLQLVHEKSFAISVPPQKPRIFTDDSNEIRLKLGPYHVGETVRMRCEALGGRPMPRYHANNIEIHSCIHSFIHSFIAASHGGRTMPC